MAPRHTFLHKLSLHLFTIILISQSFYDLFSHNGLGKAFASSGLDAVNASEKEKFFFSCSGGDDEANIELIKELISNDPSIANSITTDGETCLHLTAISNGIKITKLLLDNGANPNVRSSSEEGLRMHPLSWHVYGGRHEIVHLLLKYGANVNDDIDFMYKSDEKVTVLDLAEKLLGSDSNANSNDQDGSSDNKFQKTYDIIVANGGKKFKDLHEEL